MPLEELSDDHLVQRCSACGSAHTLAQTMLGAAPNSATGVEAEEGVLALPACTVCGAQEFLVRSSEADLARAVPGSYGHLHRLLVDHLHALVANRRRPVHSAKREKPAPTKDGDALKRWFPGGLKLAPPDGLESADSGH